MNDLCITEYGKLVQGRVENAGLGLAGVESAEDWLFLEALAFREEKDMRFIETATHAGCKALRFVNFVGVISTPAGTQIEILPKTSEVGQEVGDTRRLLWKMLGKVENLPFLQTTDADLMIRDQPLPEVLISTFLHHVAALVRSGIRRDYERIEAEEPFLRGRLRLTQQLRQPPGRGHRFQIEYDIFSANRPENRLIHSALTRVARWTRSEGNQRLAREMLFAFEATPHSQNYRSDFAKWRQGRDMAHYAPVLPWIKLILDERSPFSLKDVHRGISFLFPMEKLFERYVTQILDMRLGQLGYSVTAQLQTEYLSGAPRAFQLRPDIGVFRGGKLVGILDAKWKLIDKNARYTNGDPDPKLGIKQADVYQLLAYGHKYLKGRGKVTLIYPQWTRFDEPFSFQIGDELTLNVVPFDLVADKCAVL